jgi:hypothetical protein
LHKTKYPLDNHNALHQAACDNAMRYHGRRPNGRQTSFDLPREKDIDGLARRFGTLNKTAPAIWGCIFSNII